MSDVRRHGGAVRRILSLAGAVFCVLEPAAWGQMSGAGRAQWWAERAGTPASMVEEAQRHGVGFQYQYVQDLSTVAAGAAGERGWFGRYTWTVSATMDFKKMMGWSGTSGAASVKQHVLEFGQIYEGVDQGYSNIDSDPRTTLYEAWVQQQALGGRLTVKAGRIDANADFDAAPTAGGFLNSSMGYSPTVMEFPSYPAPQPAVEMWAGLGGATRVGRENFERRGDG